jgi:uncharacterized protein YraI
MDHDYLMKHFLMIVVAATLYITFTGGLTRTVTAQVADQVAVVSVRGAQLQSADQRPLAPLAPGALLMVQGRSADSQFLYVQTEERAIGWVDAGALLVINVNALPVVAMATTAATAASTATTPLTTTGSATGSVATGVTLLATPTPGSGQPARAAITALVTLTDSRLNLRAGPNAAYPVLVKAEPGSRWAVVGQTKAGDWLHLEPLGGGAGGWAAMRYLQLDGGGALPVITTFPPLLSSAPTVVATLPANRILQPTPAAAGTPLEPASAAATDGTTTAGAPGKSGLSGVLAFQDRIGGTIYLYDLNRDTLRALTGGIDPAISPDGQRVAFTREGGAGGLYVINRDGSGEQRIYNDHPLLRAPSWSPDGQWIVFSRANGYDDCRALRGSVCLPDEAILDALPEELQGDAEVHNLVKGLPNVRGYHTALARIAPDGSGYRDLPALDYAAAPDWNAAGIVYHSTAGIQRTADEADARSVEIANDPLLGHFHDPDWQPGGGRIVFHRKQGSHWQIYAVNPDGSGLVALTRPVTALVD